MVRIRIGECMCTFVCTYGFELVMCSHTHSPAVATVRTETQVALSHFTWLWLAALRIPILHIASHRERWDFMRDISHSVPPDYDHSALTETKFRLGDI